VFRTPSSENAKINDTQGFHFIHRRKATLRQRTDIFGTWDDITSRLYTGSKRTEAGKNVFPW
jgi:hypothetical protein